jgi:hypothetical protein
MSKLRSLNTCFWSDPWVEELNPEEKLLFIYLITNEKTNMLGIYESSIKKISFETGINILTVKKYLEGFEKVRKVKYLENHVIVINYMKHQKYNTNMKISAIEIFNNLPKELKNSDVTIDKSKPLKGFETLLNHYLMVSKVEVEDEVKLEDEGEEETNTPSATVFNFRKSLIEFGFEKNTVDQWLKIRKVKKAVNTEIAFLDITRQTDEACKTYSKSKNEILEACVRRSWAGLKSKWLEEEFKQQGLTPIQLQLAQSKKEKFPIHLKTAEYDEIEDSL